MSTETDTRDRVVRLEVKVQHLTDTVESMAEQVNQMHDLLMQARGARWAIIGAATLGGFMAAKAVTWLPWLTNLPSK
ncbi:hypothetical protein [Mesorhizobium wenxiniae]|uniref:Uncharacterized protein n=1 Tax=Mesorhizobium wenxiniae TaxID=2014805 RepID=A0A271KE64_9HYPH|nr:hypothetical protein [Mesorhizobium wenxiniae]PAP93976.1 hypothetical protein CIT31_16550 [Mesorhizobium wenxiniae]